MIDNLAGLLQDEGKLEEAAALFREALDGRRATLGDKHSATLTSANNYGVLPFEQGRGEEAAPLIRDALSGHRESGRGGHPMVSLVSSPVISL